MTTVTPVPRPATARPPVRDAGEPAAAAGRPCRRPDFSQFARLLPLGPFAMSFFGTWWVG